MSLRHALVGRKYGLDLARVAVRGPRSLSTRQLSTTSSRQSIITIKKLLSALPQAKRPVQLRDLCELLQLLSLPGLHSHPQPFHGLCSRTQVCMALSIMYCWNHVEMKIVDNVLRHRMYLTKFDVGQLLVPLTTVVIIAPNQLNF